MVVYGQETFLQIRDDVKALLPEQWSHTGDARYNCEPSWELYEKMHDAGVLLILSVRENDTLIGYLCAVVRQHPNARALRIGSVSTYFVKERPDRVFVLKRLLQMAFERLRAVGASMIDVRTEYHNSCGRLLEALGLEPNDVGYRMMVKERHNA